MNWFYSENGAQQGPISDMEVTNLSRSGVLKPETLVWHEGMADWQPLSVVRPDLVAVPDSVPNIGGMAVPEVQKDLLVQQMREGAYAPAFGAANPYGMNYAGFWIRVAAKIIDNLLLTAVTLALSFLFFGSLFMTMDPQKLEKDPEAMVAFMVAQFALIGISTGIQILYNAVMVWKWGGTVGKLAVGIRVVREDGSPVTFGRAVGRAFADFLNGFACSLTYLMVAFDEPQKRALQDHICGTRVVSK
ncbi:MAG: hypothetical protein RL693_2776 [Verrucomicrobiota bacterium]